MVFFIADRTRIEIEKNTKKNSNNVSQLVDYSNNFQKISEKLFSLVSQFWTVKYKPGLICPFTALTIVHYIYMYLCN